MDAPVPGDLCGALAAASRAPDPASPVDATETSARKHRRLPKPVRILKARPRLFACMVIGFVVFLGLTFAEAKWRMASRLLVAWDVFVGLYLVLAMQMMAGADVHRMRLRARLQDEGQTAILVLTGIAALASLGAIVALLGGSRPDARQPADLMLAVLTIVMSWALTHTIFALHYAHEYYDENSGRGGGMSFPGDDKEPDYWDFLYFSFTIGMCAQVSDVGVSCKPIRRTVLGHSIISFIFNAALLALTVNIAASAI
jgi:uncharacterized membrane protein